MEKKETALMELYDKILPYTTNGKELLAVDLLTLIQEKYLPKEREQIEEAYKQGQFDGDTIRGSDAKQYYDLIFTNAK